MTLKRMDNVLIVASPERGASKTEGEEAPASCVPRPAVTRARTGAGRDRAKAEGRNRVCAAADQVIVLAED